MQARDVYNASDLMKFYKYWKADLSKDKNDVSPMHAAAIRCRAHVLHFYAEWRGGWSADDKKGRTPMHYAARYGNEEAIRVLHELGADLDECDIEGRTPMHYAMSRSHEEAARLLHKLGSQAHNMRNNMGDTPLLSYVKDQHTESHIEFEWLSPEDVLAVDDEGKTAAHYVMRNEDWDQCDTIQLLYELNPEVLNVRCPQGRTLMHMAILVHDDMVRMLHEMGADIDARDNEGSTPLHLAVYCGNRDMIELLIELGSRAFWMEDAQGHCPDHYMTPAQRASVQEFIMNRSLLATLLALPADRIKYGQRVDGADHASE